MSSSKIKHQDILKIRKFPVICSRCGVQICLGEQYKWMTDAEIIKMVHLDCKERQKEKDMQITCSYCTKLATSINPGGIWTCIDHKYTKNDSQKFELNEEEIGKIAQEMKKYFSMVDLEKLVRAKESLKDINIEETIKDINEGLTNIRGTEEELDRKISELREVLEEQRKKIIPQNIPIIFQDRIISTIGKHFLYPELLTYLVNKKDVFVHGPAGAGKNTAVEQIAKELEMPFYCLQLSQLSLKSELTGYKNIVNDNFIPTSFVESYENGGVFLADEFDNWAPTVVTSVNMAIANNHYTFQKGRIARHKNFVFVALGNTIGMGATDHYVTSRAISGASRDRFRFLHWPIDEDLEFLMVPTKYKFWVEFVQQCRRRCNENGGLILITPRATIQGAEDLEMGFSRNKVVSNVILRGLNTPSYLIDTIEEFLGD